ncbi:MAG: ABC transporter permease [Candidatus Promineofilum sp.]|nr:ABC transporter permease [Promineifilum sp.]
MNTLWLKTLRDLWLYKARSALVVLAIAVGTAAAGVATTSFIVLRGDLRDGYRGTNPAHAILDTTPIDETIAKRISDLPEVDEAQVRQQTAARLTPPDGEERFLQLWTLPDLDATVGALYRQPGAVIPPPAGALLLERSAAPVLGLAQGDTVTIQLIDGTGRAATARLTVAGFVNDLAVAPTTVQPGVYGYISGESAAQLNLPEAYNQLRLTVSTADPDRAAVETAVTAVTEWLEAEGVVVTRAEIPEPNVHIMQGSVDTGLLMIGILGGLTLLLSAFLVTNVMSAVVTQQVPVIGVLKALGGGRGLVWRQYGRMVALFGLMALALAVPLGLMGAWFMSSFLAAQLNYDIPSFGLPWQTVVVQLIGAGLIPLLAALGPVRAAGNLTIRDALSQMGDTKDEIRDKRQRVPSYFASRISYLLAWRNVARRKVRLGLTLIALSLAGALFIATFGLKLGLDEAIEILVGEFPYDVEIDFARPEPRQQIEREAEALAAENSAIEWAEAWGVADARRVYADGRLGSSFILFGVPPTTEISPFANRTGHWLGQATNAGDDAELYINYEAEKLTAGPAVGDELTLKLNGGPERVTRLVGISLRPFNANAYMPYAAFEQATGTHDQAQRVVVYLTDDTETANDRPAQEAVAAALVARYEAAGMPVLRAETAAGYRDGYKAQFNNLVVLLMSLAGLTALVGGLGLANTMALNVLERSREIGILRSMGAGRPLLRRLVLAEGLAIALISAFFGVLLALPLTLVLDRVMGNSLLGSPLSFAFSPGAAVGWLGLVVVIGLVACWLPAEGAARMTIRAALAYE